MSEAIKTQDINELEYGAQYKQHILEQYKLYVEMADRISQRRITSNTFFVTLTSLILTTYGVIKSSLFVPSICILFAGVLLSFSWYNIVNSYKQINSVKWHLVHEIEKSLPICPYTYEWIKAGEGKVKKKYNPTSHIEKKLPLIFGLIFLVLLINSIFTY
jgi:hypothetical protein